MFERHPFPFLFAVVGLIWGFALFVECRTQEPALSGAEAVPAAESEPAGVSPYSSLYHYGESYGVMRHGPVPNFTFTRPVCVRFEHGPWSALGGPVPCYQLEGDHHPHSSED